MQQTKAQIIVKKVLALFLLPMLTYIAMVIVTSGKGQTFNIFTASALSDILKKTSYMAVVAMGIGFQLRYGRFDFSGGAIIVVSAMIGGVVATLTNGGVIVLVLVAVLSGIVLSIINSFIYTTFRIPISVCSLAAAYLFEGLSGIIIGKFGEPRISSNTTYANFGMFPLILIPFAIAAILYYAYGKFTVAGRQSKLLRENQQAAVNIGINEVKNTYITYIVSGIIFGLAGAIYATQNSLTEITSPLQTAGTLFSNIIPSLVGLFLARYIDDTAGTFVGAFTISTLYYGLETVGIKSGAKTLSYALFLAVFILVSGFWDQIWMYLRKLKEKIIQKFKKEEVTVDGK